MQVLFSKNSKNFLGTNYPTNLRTVFQWQSIEISDVLSYALLQGNLKDPRHQQPEYRQP